MPKFAQSSSLSVLSTASDHFLHHTRTLLKARIDPALSIEAYYRAQEANGIQATPKADDFDNVHRR